MPKRNLNRIIKKKQKQQPPCDKSEEPENIVIEEHQINTRSKRISQRDEADTKN